MALDFRWYCVSRYLAFTVSTSLLQATWAFRFVQLTVGEFLSYGEPPFMTALCAKKKSLYKSRTALCGFQKILLRPCCPDRGLGGEKDMVRAPA